MKVTSRQSGIHNGMRSLCGRIFYCVGNEKEKRMESKAKNYEAPLIQFLPLPQQDVLTASNQNTDLGPDIGEWDNEMHLCCSKIAFASELLAKHTLNVHLQT